MVFEYKAVSDPQGSFCLFSTVVLPRPVMDAAGSSYLHISNCCSFCWAPACRILACSKALSAGRTCISGKRSEGAGWALPSPVLSLSCSACMTCAGLRAGKSSVPTS